MKYGVLAARSIRFSLASQRVSHIRRQFYYHAFFFSICLPVIRNIDAMTWNVSKNVIVKLYIWTTEKWSKAKKKREKKSENTLFIVLICMLHYAIAAADRMT